MLGPCPAPLLSDCMIFLFCLTQQEIARYSAAKQGTISKEEPCWDKGNHEKQKQQSDLDERRRREGIAVCAGL